MNVAVVKLEGYGLKAKASADWHSDATKKAAKSLARRSGNTVIQVCDDIDAGNVLIEFLYGNGEAPPPHGQDWRKRSYPTELRRQERVKVRG